MVYILWFKKKQSGFIAWALFSLKTEPSVGLLVSLVSKETPVPSYMFSLKTKLALLKQRD